MARFDVHARKGAPGYLLDCQADLLQPLKTRFVVPLLPRAIMPPLFPRLNPTFQIEAREMVLVTQSAGAVPAEILGVPVTSLAGEQAAIMNAIDMLLSGY